MKESGVEWIGEIPEEWTTNYLKNLVQIKNGREIENDVE